MCNLTKVILVFLLSKRHTITIGTKSHIAANGVVFVVASNMFHGVIIEDGVYKVEVQGVTLLETTLIFPNMKDDLPHLLLKDVKGQFTLWKCVNL
jgi:membrane protease subunit (stomatin/prohibitin family)